MKKNTESAHKLGVSTGIVMGATALSRILGFVRTAVFSSFFGGGGTADVMNLVFSIPNNLRKLMAEGALSSAFIPVMTETVEFHPDGDRPQRLFGTLIALQCIVLLPVTILSIVFSPQIIHALFDFPTVEQHLLGTDLFRFLINYTFLVSVSAVFMGTLHSHGKFAVPSITPLLFSISVISSILFLAPSMGIYSMVAGVLIGGIGQILFQFPSLYRLGYHKLISFDFKTPEFRRILRRWVPVVMTSSVYTINHQISMFLASGLETGSSTALLNALIFWQLPFGVFSASIATVFFPTMSRQAAKEDFASLQSTINRGITSLFSLLIPSAVLLAVMGRPAIAVALQRGAFTAEYTHMAAQVLVGYSFGLFSVAAFNLIQRLFYSLGEYRIPLYVAIGTMLLDVALSLVLRETVLRVVGLAVANSAAFSVGLIIMLVLLKRRYHISLTKSTLPEAGKVVVSSVVIGVISFIGVQQFIGSEWRYGSTLVNWISTIGIGLLSIAMLILLYHIMRTEVLRFLVKQRKSL